MTEETNAAEATAAPATAAPVAEPVAQDNNPANVTPAPDAQQAEAVATPDPAEDSPEWFMKDKYKTKDEQAKAYYELSKKVGKNWGAPKDDYSIEGLEGVTKDDPLVANLAPALKELGLSQDGFTNLVKQYQSANQKMVQKFEDELKAELTGKDVATYNAVSKWMQDILKPEEIAQVKNNWLMTPADFKLFNSLRLMAGPSSSVPSAMEGNAARFESSRSVENDKITYRKEVKSGHRVTDKNHENQLAQRFRDAIAREERSKG